MAAAIGDIMQLSYRGTVAGQRIIMTRFYRCTAPSDPGNTYQDDMQGVIIEATKVAAGSISQTYLACLPSSYTLNEVRAQIVKPVRYVTVGVFQTAKVGTNTGSGNVTNLAGVITFRTGLAGRKQVSNVHIGPVPSDAPSAGVLEAAYRLVLDNLKGALLNILTPSGFDVGSWTPCIWHRKVPGPAISYDYIQSGVVQQTARTMSRRTVGRGE